MTRKTWGQVFAAVMVMSLLFGGCSKTDHPGDDEKLSGTLTISGAWALYPMVVQWSEEFRKVYPDVQFDISAGGAGKGMTDALSGAADIGMVSREVKQEEIDQGAFWVTVVADAVLPTINAHNPQLARIQAQGLTRADFEAIWMGKAKTWGDVLDDASITDEIHVYTRSDACGAAETWALYLGQYKQEDLQGVAVYGDPGLAEAVAQDPLGIGFNNLNFAYDMNTGKPIENLDIAPIDMNENGTLDDVENYYADKQGVMLAIAERRYPSPPARGLNLVTKGKPTGLTLAFIRWTLTAGQSFAEPTGYIPLTEAQVQTELAKIE
ncbi:MAG TPA: substrate-binding domain-containing protein [Anaerolineae bacterium]|nr:substrate-binding domain-containing protein [Anaerolineae bacterium]HQH37293.1 substrate-binding domain-containing protein [Anaerolineae bacterium]